MTTQSTTATALHQARNSMQRSFDKPSADAENLGKSDFLKLLMAQVVNQDPLNPMDSQGMMDQLTSMGSLEQLVNINSTLGELGKTQADLLRATTFNYLDKDVTVRGGGIPIKNGRAPNLQFNLPREVESVLINIFGKSGDAVRQLKLGAYGPGTHDIGWDSLDGKGQTLSDGFYRYTVIAKDADDVTVPADLYIQGKVSGVRFENGRTKLKVNGEEMDIRDVIELSNRSERIFGNRLPAALREEITPRGPATRLRK